MELQEFIDFLLLRDANVRYVVIGSMLIGASAALVGSFLFLKKRALVGDAIAHSVLPGICLAFILFQTKSPLILLLGAIATGWISLVVIDLISNNSKIKSDTSIGLTLSWFFGIGIMLLTSIQKTGNAAQSGLDKFLFGNASAMLGEDVFLFSGVSIVLIAMTLFLFKPLKLVIFDRDFARSKGVRVGMFELALSTMTVIAVAAGIKAVGVVLMAALLITPAAAARFWTNDLRTMLLLASLFGMISGWSGAFVSYTLPRMSTGPWIVLVVSFIAIFSFFFGTQKGMVNKLWAQRKMQHKIANENVLKLFYHLGEELRDFTALRTFDELMNKRFMSKSDFNAAFSRLKRRQLVFTSDGRMALTDQGVKEGQRLTRLHRLWELYLIKYVKVAPDHVHDDAEAIEHIITPEIEAELVALLDNPDQDPHNKNIPYSEES